MAKPNRSGRKSRLVRRLLTLPFLLLAVLIAWNQLRPLLSDETITTYASYSASRGDIATFNSYNATIDVLHSEIISNSRQVTSVKKVFVQANQDVREGDKLMQLESGDVLKAGIDGTVNEIRFGEGDWIWPNVSLIQICDLTNLQASLSVDEYDITNVSVGEPCLVTIVPLGLSFETEISHVDRVSTASGSVAYYLVTAEVTVPENVLPGMTASVSIPARSVHDVVTLDMAALSFEADDSPYVLVKQGETYEKRPVETGLSDGMKIEILAGLSEGDVVYRVSGTEKAVKALSLADVYKHIAGEKVVIRDRSGGARGGMPGGMPGGFAFPGADASSRPNTQPAKEKQP